MFTEDYLMRIINLTVAALLNAIGLRKSGKYSEALQMLEQAIQQLTGLPADVVEQLDDASVLLTLSVGGTLDIGRLAVLGDLFQEESILFSQWGQSARGVFAVTRALRFLLEVLLADDSALSPESMVKVESLVNELKQNPLPIDTKLALSDYYRRLLTKEDQELKRGGLTRRKIDQALIRLQEQIDASMNTIGD